MDGLFLFIMSITLLDVFLDFCVEIRRGRLLRKHLVPILEHRTTMPGL